jgi:RHS repeat-associated protein
VTDASGQVVGTAAYDAFGAVRQQSGTQAGVGFAGEQTDAESGLVYLRARYYDPTTGRFLSKDPVRGGRHAYVYARNNPLRYRDRSGREAEPAGGATVSGEPGGGVGGGEHAGIGHTVPYDVPYSGDWYGEGRAGAYGPLYGCGTFAAASDCVGTGGGSIPITPAGVAAAGIVGVVGGVVLANATSGSGGGGRPPVPDFVHERARDPLNPNPPAPGFEWQGSGPPGSEQGNWVNQETGENMHPHVGGGHGPHVDYRAGPRGSPEARVYPDGRVEWK